MPYTFNGSSNHTLGVEIELQIVDRDTLALSNSVQSILDRVPPAWVDKVKPELMQSYCELNTDICNTVKDVQRDLAEKLAWSRSIADVLGLRLLWSGTHAFSPWHEQRYSPGERYRWLTEVMQEISRRLVVFGLHVHVGVDSGDKATCGAGGTRASPRTARSSWIRCPPRGCPPTCGTGRSTCGWSIT
jgi:carboxylate-amine ligase